MSVSLPGSADANEPDDSTASNDDLEVRRFARLRQVFAEFSEIPEGDLARRTEFLGAVSANEPELVAPLEELLSLSECTVSPLDTVDWAETQPPWTDRVGSYRVLREIGRGGSSIVYLAEQEGEGFTRQVALKRLVSTETSAVLADRAGAEQRILAALEHPGIARLYDAGRSAEGVPYLAMEYVEGLDIVSYRTERDLDLRSTLELVLQVAEALDFAHQRYIVHRDIKPRNILVAADGRARLLDFGIARILDPETDDATRTHLRAMTPAYASPEQLRGDRVGPPSDQYSLGVVLYELLCGRRPFESRDRSWAATERAIQEQEPTAPSVVIGMGATAGSTGGGSASADSSDALARDPDTATTRPAGWRRSIAGDLDTIVLKALRKAPAARYRSVADFAADLRNYLEGRAIAARRGSVTYRVSKFARRHRAPLAASAAASAAAVMLAFPRAPSEPFSPWLSHAPRRGEVRANYLAGLADMREHRGAAAAQSLARAAEREPANPLIVAALAQAHRLEGRETLAAAEAERAAGLAVKLPNETRLWLEGLAAIENGRPSAVDTLRSLWTLYPGEIELGLELARTLCQSGRGTEALEVVVALRRLLPEKAGDVRIDLAEMAALDDAGRFRDAGQFAERLLDSGKLTGASPMRLSTLLFTGLVRVSVGDQEGARDRVQEILPLVEQVGEDQHRARADFLQCRIDLYAADHEALERHCGRALEIYRDLGNQSGAAQSLNALGVSRRRRGQLTKARATLEEALAIQRRRGDRNSEGRVLNNLANIDRDLGRLEDAERNFRASIDIRRESGETRGIGLAVANLGMILLDRGRIADAERTLTESESLLKESGTGRELSRLFEERARLAEYRAPLPEIESAMAAAIQVRIDIGEEDARRYLEARREAVRCRAGSDATKPEVFEVAHRALRELGDSDSPQVLIWWADCMVGRGDLASAKELLDLAGEELSVSEQPLPKLRTRLVRARWEIATGRLGSAAGSVEEVLSESRRHGFGPETLEAALVEVQLARARGEAAARVRTLAETVEERAREQGFLNLAASAARLRSSA